MHTVGLHQFIYSSIRLNRFGLKYFNTVAYVKKHLSVALLHALNVQKQNKRSHELEIHVLSRTIKKYPRVNRIHFFLEKNLIASIPYPVRVGKRYSRWPRVVWPFARPVKTNATLGWAIPLFCPNSLFTFLCGERKKWAKSNSRWRAKIDTRN